MSEQETVIVSTTTDTEFNKAGLAAAIHAAGLIPDSSEHMGANLKTLSELPEYAEITGRMGVRSLVFDINNEQKISIAAQDGNEAPASKLSTAPKLDS